MTDIFQEAIKLLEEWEPYYSQKEEMRDVAIAALKSQSVEIDRLRKDLRTAILGDSAELRDAKKEIERLRERLAKVSDDNQRMRQSIREYVGNSTRITNDMLLEMWERECGDK